MPDFRTVLSGVIEDLGNTSISIVNYTAGTFNDYGDVNYTTSTITATAVVVPLSEGHDLVEEGYYQSGDFVFYIDSTYGSNVSTGDVIRHSSTDYGVNEIVPYELSGNVQVYEVRTKRKA